MSWNLIKEYNKSSSLLVKLDYSLILLIVCSSFLIYFHLLVPEGRVWETAWFKWSPKVTPSAQAFVYHILTKLSPLIFFSIWYITENHWWRHSILLPIVILNFQLITNLLDNLNVEILQFENSEYLLIGLYILFLVSVNKLLKYHKRNLGVKFNIDSDNLYLIPSSSQNQSKISRIKNTLDQEKIGREQLNLIYKEYNYISGVNNSLANGQQSSVFRLNQIKFSLELLLFIIILISPFSLFIYQLTEPGVYNYELLGINIPSFGFLDSYTFLWVFYSKLIIILPISLWFFTSRHWWKYFLLIPFAVGLFQLLEIFKSSGDIDGSGFMTLGPIILVIIGVMVFLTRRVRKYVMLAEFYSTMEQKINNTIKQISIDEQGEEKKQLKEELTKLIKEHKRYKPEEYLSRLKEIKSRLEALKDRT